MIETLQKFRKKYTLSLLIWAAGTALAFIGKASLGEYTAFTGVLLTIFGSADLVDKKVTNRGSP